MARDLFDTVTDPPAHIGGRSGLTLSLLTHAAVLAAIVVVPLIATDALPSPNQAMSLIMVGTSLPQEPPPRAERGSWTAISKPPYFSALAIWPSLGRWTGGASSNPSARSSCKAGRPRSANGWKKK